MLYRRRRSREQFETPKSSHSGAFEKRAQPRCESDAKSKANDCNDSVVAKHVSLDTPTARMAPAVRYRFADSLAL